MSLDEDIAEPCSVLKHCDLGYHGGISVYSGGVGQIICTQSCVTQVHTSLSSQNIEK